jgi:hypothetical protein
LAHIIAFVILDRFAIAVGPHCAAEGLRQIAAYVCMLDLVPSRLVRRPVAVVRAIAVARKIACTVVRLDGLRFRAIKRRPRSRGWAAAALLADILGVHQVGDTTDLLLREPELGERGLLADLGRRRIEVEDVGQRIARPVYATDARSHTTSVRRKKFGSSVGYETDGDRLTERVRVWGLP